MQVSVNEIKRPSRIVPDMLVQHIDGSIGLVTAVTRKWVHVTWLVNTAECTPCHFNSTYHRDELIPCPVGTKLTIKQKA